MRLFRRKMPPPQMVRLRAVWEVVTCPLCGRTVAFMEGQAVNRCAWCQTEVIR